MAHKKAAGSAKNLRDSNPKYRGVKLFGGQFARAGNIIIRQKGDAYHVGKNVYKGNDFTIHATIDGIVHFRKKNITKYNGRVYLETVVDIIPLGEKEQISQTIVTPVIEKKIVSPKPKVYTPKDDTKTVATKKKISPKKPVTKTTVSKKEEEKKIIKPSLSKVTSPTKKPTTKKTSPTKKTIDKKTATKKSTTKKASPTKKITDKKTTTKKLTTKKTSHHAL